MAFPEKKKPSLAEATVKEADADAESKDDDSEFAAAAEELFDAVKAGDASAFKDALSACMSCHK